LRYSWPYTNPANPPPIWRTCNPLS
jgi:hypothetical protein